MSRSPLGIPVLQGREDFLQVDEFVSGDWCNLL